MKYCPYCGTALQIDMVFCPECGKQLKPTALNTEPTLESTKSPNQKATYNESLPNASSNNLASKNNSVTRIIIAVLVILVLVAGGVVGLIAMRKNAVTKAADSVLYIEILDQDNNIIGTASGFVINDGRTLVTNFHVIQDAYKLTATTPDGAKSTNVSTVIGYNEVSDIAILACDNNIDVKPLTIGDSSTAEQGATVYAIGYPLGIANTLSNGVLSSRYTDEYGVDMLQFTAPISQGNSGGALIDKTGKVIGVVCAYYEGGQNLNLAVSSQTLQRVINSNSNKRNTLSNLYQQLSSMASIRKLQGNWISTMDNGSGSIVQVEMTIIGTTVTAKRTTSSNESSSGNKFLMGPATPETLRGEIRLIDNCLCCITWEGLDDSAIFANGKSTVIDYTGDSFSLNSVYTSTFFRA